VGAQAQARPRAPIGSIILLIVAGFLYLAMAASLADVSGSDSAGRGIAMGFGMIFGAALWLVLALLLLIAAINGAMPVVGKIGAAVLLPVSAVAASVAVDLYSHRADWAFAIVLILPLLIAIYALWARLPGLHASLPPLLITSLLGGVLVLLCLAPLAGMKLAAAATPSPEVQAAADQAREAAQRQEEEAAIKLESEAFAKLGPDSSLRDYLLYLPGGDSRSRDALAGARKVKSRQADAVALLNAGRLEALTDLFRLDLLPAPELCQAYDNALANAASQVTKARSDYLSIAIDLEQQLPNIKWLVAGGCNLDGSLGLLAGHVRAVSDSQRMATFARTLSGLMH
jgi:hypothetical protein